jgi:hypothetical protein
LICRADGNRRRLDIALVDDQRALARQNRLTAVGRPSLIGPATVAIKQHLGTRITASTARNRIGGRDLNQTVTMNRANLAQWE